MSNLKGACPDIKIPTIITRLGQSHIQPALLFFRTSATSRATPRFLRETRILPPLSYNTCIQTLEELSKTNDALEIHYADEEGDPYSVELAGRVGGYVVGNDSDFVILNAPGYLGYIPLDDIVWGSTALEQSLPVDSVPVHDFQTVTKPKFKKKHQLPIGKGMIPPEGSDDLHLTCTVYHPDVLASYLSLPVTLLPLLGALVGNDFTHNSDSDRRSFRSYFFDKRLTVVQCIENAATTMRSVLSPTTPRKKNKHQVGSVMDLIDRTVNMLLSRLHVPLGTGEVNDIVDKVVLATLQYAIHKHDGDEQLWPTAICALHEPDICSLLPLMSRRVLEESEGVDGQTPALIQSATIRDHYVEAYRDGHFSPKLMDVLDTGTSWPRLFLETPDLETVSRSITRPLRQWIYSILDDSLGLPIPEWSVDETDTATESQDQNGEVRVDEDEDELIDVVESDSEEERVDFLAPLKGELQRLHISDDDVTETDGPVSVVSQRSNRIGTPRVTEYVRRGTRIAAEVVHVTPLDDLLSSISFAAAEADVDTDETISLVQKPIEERLTAFLRILDSDLPSVRNLPSERLQPVLTTRWIARCLHQRALETGSRDREKEQWSSHEAKCFFASLTSWTSSPAESYVGVDSEFPPVQDRNLQLSAQLLSTMETVEHLAQTLLLTSFVPSVAHQFSGRHFHSLLSGKIIPSDNSVVEDMWRACQENLLEAFREDRVKKDKKTRKAGTTATASVQKKKKAGMQAGFALLAGLNE